MGAISADLHLRRLSETVSARLLLFFEQICPESRQSDLALLEPVQRYFLDARMRLSGVRANRDADLRRSRELRPAKALPDQVQCKYRPGQCLLEFQRHFQRVLHLRGRAARQLAPCDRLYDIQHPGAEHGPHLFLYKLLGCCQTDDPEYFDSCHRQMCLANVSQKK